jgi:hypothetical protein
MYTALIYSSLLDKMEDTKTAPKLHLAMLAAPVSTPLPTPSEAKSEHCKLPSSYALKAVHSETGKLCEYKVLLTSTEGHLWQKSCSEEFHRLCARTDNIPGTNTMFFINQNKVPMGRKVTYMRLVVTDRPMKANPH